MPAKQSDVQSRLKPIHGLLSKVILNAWDKYRQQCALPLGPGHARARANSFWVFIVDEARSLFAEVPEMHIETGNQTARFTYHNSVQFRFKKIDPDGYTRNYPTQAALGWLDPENDLFPNTVRRVEVGYILDPTETGIEDIRIVHQHLDQVSWQYSILNEASEVIPLGTTGGDTASEDFEEELPKVAIRAKSVLAKEPIKKTDKN